MTRQIGIQARLKSGGDAVDITDFTLTVAAGELGSTLACSLAAFSPVIDESESVTFEIGIRKGGAVDWAMMLADSRIKDRSDATRLKADQTALNIISKLSQKWKLTPRIPITLYDPAQVDIVTETSQSRNDVIDSNGNAITPIYTPVDSFNLNQLLNFIYAEKLGFGQVITNIPSYPLQRADFSLRSPYHSVAAGQIALFEPKYSSESVDSIFIVDPQGTLPTGFPSQVRSCPPGSYLEFQKTKQIAPETNAVLLTYRDASGSDEGSITDRVDQEIKEVGTFGEKGWQRSVINRFVKEFHGDTNDTSKITREVVWKVETRTSAKAGGVVREIAIESQTDLYEQDWQLKVGYTKTVNLYTKLPGQSALMRQVQTETNKIIYTGSNSNPNELLKTWELTQINGAILVEGDEDDEENPATKISLYEANRTNNISDDAEAQLGKDIKTIIERWREIGSDQIEVQYQVVDHLTEKIEQNKTVQHTGTVRVRLGNNQGKQVTILLRDEASEETDGTLPPAALDAGDIPFGPALELGNRVLARHGQQPQRISIQFGGLDLSLRRGSLRRASDRAGNEFLVFITGYTIEGKLTANEFGVSQSAEGIVLQEL